MMAMAANDPVLRLPILHPALASLHERREAARLLLAAGFERLEAQQMEAEYLQAIFDSRLGPLQLECLRAGARRAALDLEIRLLSDALRRQGGLSDQDLAQVDAKVRQASDAQQRQIDEQMERNRQAQVLLADARPVSQEEAMSAKRLYRSLARRLHPDIVPDGGGNQRRYWDLVQIAYRAVDLELLTTLDILVPVVVEREGGILSELEAEIAGIEERTIAVMRRCETNEKREPLCYARQLRDERWIRSKIDEMEWDIEATRTQIVELETFRNVLRNGVATH
ncbi:MAG: hypothetical protein RBT51_14320 [Ectothiorhodospiraceae bacterium]|jgi:hypothetical protein|nr:hypothetical protein [Ectothiorhodospiraceae bacterium]